MTTTTNLRYNPWASFEVRSRDLVYRRDGGREFPVRVFEPQGTGPFPALVGVHGGAWGPSSVENEALHEELASSGLVVAAIDFRTSAEAPHPAAQEDINYGTRWLKAHAPELNAASEGVGIVGWSSGGHQVMLAAMRPEQYATIPLPEAPAVDARPAYVIMGWPVIDPLSRYGLVQQLGKAETIAKHLAYFGDEAGMVEANPQLILDRGEAVEMPPALLLQGGGDEGLTRFMAERFVESYARAGGVIELGKYGKEPHGFMRLETVHTKRAFKLLKSFVARQLEELGAIQPE